MTTAQVPNLGYSTCPNDTFMFHALVHGSIPDLPVDPVVYMADIEALNERALGSSGAERLAWTKVSAGALPWLTRDYTVLRAGAALGRGCGPLVVVRADAAPDGLASLAGKRVAIPGERTTAALLLRIFGPPDYETRVMRFDAIMPAVARGEVDAGLIIHESRFTYPAHGLHPLADLGELWEGDAGLPLPLGVIVALRSLGEGAIARFETALSASVRHAFAHPEQSTSYIRLHAQEMSDDVCRQHIELYVNPYSEDIGDEGRSAIDALLTRGVEVGALPPDTPSPWR